MADQSKIASTATNTITTIILNSLIGSPSKKAFSSVLLAIIAFLIYMKNKKSATDNIKISEEKLKKKSVHHLLSRKEEEVTLTQSLWNESKNY